MKLSAPKQITWIIAVILGVLGLLGSFDMLGMGSLAFWLTFLGFHATFLVQHWVGAEGMPRRSQASWPRRS